MTIRTKTTFKGFFETGDVPQQQDYADLFDSCVMCAETTAQSMTGSLNVASQLAAASVSAGTGTFGNLTASAVTFSSLTITNLTATSANFTTLQVSTASAANITIHNGTVTGTLGGASDRRFKENIIPLPEVIKDLMLLNPVFFNKIGSVQRESGFIAQEVQKVFPWLVMGNEEEGLSINYLGLIALILKGLQEHERKMA